MATRVGLIRGLYGSIVLLGDSVAFNELLAIRYFSTPAI
jgi:hypothetical protein